MSKQDYAKMIKAGEQVEPVNGEFPEAYMEALHEYIDAGLATLDQTHEA